MVLHSDNETSQLLDSTPPNQMVGQFWDAVVWMGDFNSRIHDLEYPEDSGNSNTPQESMVLAIKANDYDTIIKHDQLSQDFFSNEKKVEHPFQEGHFDVFPPTYKLNSGQELYWAESGEPYQYNYTPGYTDRILFWSANVGSNHVNSRRR